MTFSFSTQRLFSVPGLFSLFPFLLPLLLSLSAAAGESLKETPAVPLNNSPSPLEMVTLSVPGPRNLSFLPIDLITPLGLDKAEGLNLKILHTGGGAVSLSHLSDRTADFAVAGAPAVMSFKVQDGGDVAVIAPIGNAPLFVLMVRSSLKGTVKKISDLKGRTLGVTTSTKSSKTTSQQLFELLLKSEGVSLDSVRLVPAGQSWEEQSSLILTGAADAIMGAEPFASRLLAQGKVFFLANLADPQSVKKVKGAGFLHSVLVTRKDVIKTSPQRVEKVVRIIKKSLDWVAHHSAEQITDAFALQDKEERLALISVLKKYPLIYSKTGLFSSSQIQETNYFFQSQENEKSKNKNINLESLIDSSWTGPIE